MSGSLLGGVSVADVVGSEPTSMAVRILNQLGASVGSTLDADVVIADLPRGTGDSTEAVWVCVTPFGASGPRSSWRASDLGVMAVSGNLYCTGDPDRAPVRCAGDAAYAHTAPEIAFAALTALASGVRPVDVDLSMQETVLVANMGGAGRWFRSRIQARRAGANIGRTREIWPTKDGWVSFGLRGGKARIPSLQTISRLIDDPVLTERDWTAWDVLTASGQDVDDVQRVVGEWFSRHSTAELYGYACETNLMLAPVNSPRELYASAQLAAREFFDTSGVPDRWAHVHVRSDGDGRRDLPREVEPTPQAGAWEGTWILEFGAGAAGPIATRYFAEHGATVLRVESASRPDFLRTGNYADMFDALNCGKRSVTLNLKHREGHALAKRLVVEWAHAVGENFAPRAMRGLGLAYDDLVVDKPDLVMVSACLNGQTGPHRDYPGFGGQGAALSGFNYLTGWPDREPIGPFGTITDSLAPRFVATALAAALLHHRATGEGVYVDLSQVECAVWTLSDWLLAYRRDGVIGERRGNAHPDVQLHGVFRCAGDDRWVAIAAWTGDELERLTAITGDDVDAWTATRDPLAVATELQAAGIEAVPVQDFADLNADPQLAQRGHFVALDHPDLGPGEYERNGFRIDGLPTGYDRSGPTLGQDNEWVLGEVLGLSTAEQTRLEKNGAFVAKSKKARVSDPSTQGEGWHPDPSGQHELRYWDGRTWTENVSDGGQQATDPIPPAPPGGVPATQYGAVAQYGEARQRGPVGRPANAGTVILLTIVTLGIYSLIWTYRQFEDFKKYSGQGLGGTVGVILGIFINPVVWFLIPAELQGNLYEPEGEQCPVSPLWGLWFLLPIIGNFIWYLKMQDVINDFWIRRGAPAP